MDIYITELTKETPLVHLITLNDYREKYKENYKKIK